MEGPCHAGHLVFWGGPSLWDEVFPWLASSSSHQQDTGDPPAHFNKTFSTASFLCFCVLHESMQGSPFAVFLMVLMHLSPTWGGST